MTSDFFQHQLRPGKCRITARQPDDFLQHCAHIFLKLVTLQPSLHCRCLFPIITDRLADLLYAQLSFLDFQFAPAPVYQSIAVQFAEKTEWIYVRCIIQEIADLKEKHCLKGSDSHEEYLYFLQHYLSQTNFLYCFFKKYPLLIDLLYTKVQSASEYINELFAHLDHDKDMICRQLCDDRRFSKVINISTNLSDEHLHGRTVVKIELDNGCTIFHKPHSILNAVNYHKLQQWLFEQCRLDDYPFKAIDYGTYGWELEIPHCACQSSQDIEAYYERFGIQLCLAYSLNVSDLHFENIIACGKYPVFVDLEVFPNRINCVGKFKHLSDFFKDTILTVGLLPKPVSKNHIDGSGTDAAAGKTMPFKMPSVADAQTSDIHIEYIHPRLKQGKNFPVYHGQIYLPNSYATHILEGFDKASQCLTNQKTYFIKRLDALLPERSRCVLRPTQEYLMYQNLMNFPELLIDWHGRISVLNHMQRDSSDADTPLNKAILNYEKNCIVQMLIPAFLADDCYLYTTDGRIIEALNDTVPQYMLKRISDINYSFQRDILCTLFLKDVEQTSSGYGFKNFQLTPKSIAAQIIKKRIFFKQNNYWTHITYDRAGIPFLTFSDDYLYHGRSGIALYLTSMAVYTNQSINHQFSRHLIKNLFNHTNDLCSQNTTDRPWGLFTGEASLIYVFLLLNNITGQKIYLTYAQKQAEYVICHLHDILENDLLDGRAGVILILAVLYKITHQKIYLNASEVLFKQMMESAYTSEQGIGWPSINGKILAGLAHGCSGIALAPAYLYHLTGRKAYKAVTAQILKYENTLYNPESGNWTDLRSSKADYNTSAWCHGAPGILGLTKSPIFFVFQGTALPKVQRKI